MTKTPDEIKSLAEPIRARIALIREKIVDLESELEGELARLRGVQRKCDHPRAYEKSSMGDSGFHCPDCGKST